jgi:hypothetical protein
MKRYLLDFTEEEITMIKEVADLDLGQISGHV